MIENLAAKIKAELAQKQFRERQVLHALSRVRSRGEKSISLDGLTTEIYGSSLDQQTRSLALEPFIGEVL